MSLPEVVVFSIKTAEHEVRYLSFSGPQRQLRFGYDDGVHDENARFTVEPAGNGLVHIRSCYENHYWTRPSRFDPWIVASSPEVIEDMSNDKCTLFRPRMSAGNIVVGFVHVQSGLNVVMRPPADAYAYNLCVELAAPTEFNFTNYSNLASTKLPRYLMFVSDDNKYMRALGDDGTYSAISAIRGQHQDLIAFIGFPDDKPTDHSVVFEIVYTKNGDIRLKSKFYDDFFNVGDTFKYLVIDLAPFDIPIRLNSAFEVVLSSPPNIASRGIALRYRDFDQFCCRLDVYAHSLFLVDGTSPHDKNAWLQPRYADKLRVNIESFRHFWAAPKTSRFFRERVFTNTGVQVRSYNFDVNYQEFNRITFSNGISYVRRHTAVFNGRMPSVTSSGNLEFSDVDTEITSFWGVASLSTAWNNPLTNVTVPARTTAIVRIYINIATYEVPFSYEQVDEFPFDGEATVHLHDGVCTVQYEYNFETRPEFQPLTDSHSDEILGVEVEGEPGFFVYEVPHTQDNVIGDDPVSNSFDQGSVAQDNPTPLHQIPLLRSGR